MQRDHVRRRSRWYGAAFSPLSLFFGGANGAWYDPSDFSTMFQDAAGTTPVTAVGQPVGLMLDKSKGLVLGPELVTNGDFSSSSGWVLSTLGGSATISGGLLTLSGGSSAYPNATQSAVLTSGRWYKVVVVLTSTVTSGSLSLRLGGSTSQYTAFTNAGIYTLNVLSNGADLMLIRNSGFTDTITIDNISVRELPGNHAFNPSGNSANFPVLSARYNLLTKTEQFDDAVWTKTSIAASADKLIPSNSNTAHYVSQAITASSSNIEKVQAKADGYNWIALWSNSTQSGAYFNVATGVVGNTSAGVTATIAPTADGWFDCTVSRTATDLTQYQLFVANANGGAVFVGDGVSGVRFRKPDLRVANDALNQPAYQRVNTATDYDTVGFKPYLSFNGVNQWLQTNSIDFTYGDKMFVCAGVRKLSDAALGMVAELSTYSASGSNPGAFFVLSGQSSGPGPYWAWLSSGSSYQVANSAALYPSPISNVNSGIGSISGDQAILRINGTQAAINTADQGAGNYGNYPLYIGARAGTSLWFNGRLYGLVVAGKQASASEIASTEAWLNQKTGAY